MLFLLCVFVVGWLVDLRPTVILAITFEFLQIARFNLVELHLLKIKVQFYLTGSDELP